MFVHLDLKKKAFFGHYFIYKMKTVSRTIIIQCFLKSRRRQLSEFVNEIFLGGFGHRFSAPHIFFYPGFLQVEILDFYIAYIFIHIYMARSQIKQESRVKKMWGAENLWPNPPKIFSFTNSESWHRLLFKKHWMIIVRLTVFIL